MDKELYFEELDEIINDLIYVGLSKLDLQYEINNNMWKISLWHNLVGKVTPKDFMEFFNNIIQNRRYQVKKLFNNHEMIFYLWFDKLASQICFNVISKFHKHLPFQCEYMLVDNMEDIINDFLQHPFHEGLPIEGFNGVEAIEKKLKVYRVELT